MKYLLLAILFISCNNNKPQDKSSQNTSAEKNSSAAVSAHGGESSRCDSLAVELDSLKKKLFVANFKVERVRYYLNICQKNPSQSKFLKGWVSRAVQ